MAGLLYHVPGADWLVPESGHLAAAGLADVLGGAPVEALPCTGPDGSGVLLYCPDDPPELRGYHPERQAWRRRSQSPKPKAPGPAVSVGYWRDARPGPADLARPRQVPGHMVELAGGERWLVPIGRCFDGRPGLPCAYVLEAGQLAAEVCDEYVALWADVLRIWTREQLPDPELVAIAHRALAVNYRLGSDEINLLKLITDQTVGPIVAALIDAPTIAAVKQEVDDSPKKAEAGEASPGTRGGDSTDSGGSAPSPATRPASPTSAGCSRSSPHGPPLPSGGEGQGEGE